MPIPDTESFAYLLGQYMRRIRANANEVAEEVDISRQTGRRYLRSESAPKKKEIVLKIAKYLRLTEQETNELLLSANFKIEYPMIGDLARDIFTDFINKELFVQLEQIRPFHVILLLTQANWGEPPCLDALLVQARKKYSPNNVLHITPPLSLNTSENEYFAALAKQCKFEGVENDYQFETALEKSLEHTKIFLLVSRFEQGHQPLREKLASLLRAISEQNPERLHIMMCGGEKLADLKYKSGDLSLLNFAEVVKWPELSHTEVYALCKRRFPKLKLSDKEVSNILTISGAHPLLLNECLKLRQQEPNFSLKKYPQRLAASDSTWQLFTPFVTDTSTELKQQLGKLLQQKDLGQAVPYIFDDLLRGLYWKNLLVERDKLLSWRCEVIRTAGMKVLEQVDK